MTLPANIDPAKPAGTDQISSGDDEIRALKQFIVDILGLPVSPTNMTAAMFATSAAGLVKVVGRQQLSKGVDIVSAAALTLGTDGNYFDVTGAVTITSITGVGVGTVIRLHFIAAPLLTHNATTLVLPGGINRQITAGDEATFIEYSTGNWRLLNISSHILADLVVPANSGYKQSGTGGETLRIVRGTVPISGTTALAGTGFTITSNAAGTAAITFDTNFSSVPTILVSRLSVAVGSIGVDAGNTVSGFTCRRWSGLNVPEAVAFSFTAVGPA